MMKWAHGVVATGLVLAVGGAAIAQQPAPRGGQDRQPPAADANTPGELPRAGDRADLPGPIDSPKDVQDTLKLAFMMADANHDGLISKQEATDMANMAVGGLFFRADADGDGKVTQDEARQVRQQVLRQQPILRLFVSEAKRQNSDQPNPLRQLAGLLDENNDKQLAASELRDAVQTGVDAVYASADTDRDSQMSPAELNAAAIGIARAAGQAAFAAADADNSGAISREEFEKAILEPARVAFGVIDVDNDGQVSAQEAQLAQRMLMSQLQVAIPDARGQQAPIPNFGSAVEAIDRNQGQGENRNQNPGRNPNAPRPAQPTRTIPPPAAPAAPPAPGTPR